MILCLKLRLNKQTKSIIFHGLVRLGLSLERRDLNLGAGVLLLFEFLGGSVELDDGGGVLL